MLARNGIATAAWALTALLGASTAHGDGPCDKGFRDTTAAERATMTAVLEAAKKALPPAPEGWIIRGDDQVSVTLNLCRDFERQPWSYSFSREYQRVDDYEARQGIVKQAADNYQADLAQKQPRLDAVMAKMNALVQKQIALVEKGEMEKASAMNEEMAALQEQYKTIMDEGTAGAQNEALLQEASRDQTMYISVAVNSPAVSADTTATGLTVPAGAKSAYRWSETKGNLTEGSALVLLGQWKPTTPGRSELQTRVNARPEAAHAIAVRLQADESRFAPTLAAIDFKGLAKIVAP